MISNMHCCSILSLSLSLSLSLNVSLVTLTLATPDQVPATDGGFVLPEAKSSVSWKTRDILLIGTDTGPGALTDSGYPRQVHSARLRLSASLAVAVPCMM